ncbi:MAG: Spy/CpxP family protein refolding chaperone [Flavobacteriales bacterium]|jgi:Spy/CpxP family protein refolding chaperone
MSMKNGIILLVVLIIHLSAFAQKPRMDGDKIKQLRIAFISEELELTTEEGQAFWPIFNDYEKQTEEQNGQIKEARSEVKGKKDEPSTEQVEESIRKTTEIRVAMAISHESYMLDCLEVLGPDKTMKLGGVERRFKKALLDRAKGRRPDGPPPKQR